MNRAEFFAQMKHDIVQTVKEIVTPLIEDDVEKIDHFVDKIAGYKWVLIEKPYDPKSFEGIDELFIGGHSIFIFSTGKEIKAVDKTCKKCHSFFQWISYEKKIKCLNCERSYDIYHPGEENIHLQHYKMKRQQGKWMIALKEK